MDDIIEAQSVIRLVLHVLHVFSNISISVHSDLSLFHPCHLHRLFSRSGPSLLERWIYNLSFKVRVQRVSVHLSHIARVGL